MVKDARIKFILMYMYLGDHFVFILKAQKRKIISTIFLTTIDLIGVGIR